MTDHPDLIGVSEDVRLRRFDPGSADEGLLQSLLPIYRDAETVRLLDGPQAEPYDLARLVAMYTAMSERGELYLVEALSSTGVGCRSVTPACSSRPCRWCWPPTIADGASGGPSSRR